LKLYRALLTFEIDYSESQKAEASLIREIQDVFRVQTVEWEKIREIGNREAQ
jgi:hypothetical protein